MRHGKNPTVRQKKFISAHKLDCNNWLVMSDTHEKMELVHRNTNTTRTIIKDGGK